MCACAWLSVSDHVCLWLIICVWSCVFVHNYVCDYVCLCMMVCMSASACASTCASVCACARLRAPACACMRLHAWACVRVCVCMRIILIVSKTAHFFNETSQESLQVDLLITIIHCCMCYAARCKASVVYRAQRHTSSTATDGSPKMKTMRQLWGNLLQTKCVTSPCAKTAVWRLGRKTEKTPSLVSDK